MVGKYTDQEKIDVNPMQFVCGWAPWALMETSIFESLY